MDGEGQSTDERIVEIGAQISSEYGDSVVLLHFLQQIGNLYVRVAVVRIAYLRAFAEKRIGFVKKQDAVGVLGRSEDPVQVLLGFADVLADHTGQVDFVKFESQRIRDDLRRHGFPRAGWAGEQRSEEH